MFSMVSDTKEVNKYGTGFGLYISNELCKYLSPKDCQGIKLISKYGKGSDFYFLLENKK